MQLIQLGKAASKRSVAKQRKKVLFIEPYPENNVYRMAPKERQVLWFPKLSIPSLAAYTPSHWEMQLVDESVDVIDYNAQVDLVGISAMTCYAPRAYEIAQRFRAKGITVVLGGVHPSYMPDEAAHYADSVVIGEAENTWPMLLQDFEEGKLQKFYRMESFPAMEGYRQTRLDLLRQDAYMTGQCLMTTRGCHFECEFCSVSPFNGKTTRRRPVPEVIAEMQRVKEWRQSKIVDKMLKGPIFERFKTSIRFYSGIEDGTFFAFVDDLHNSNRTYCKELWTALKALDIKWGAQCTLFLGDEPDMVKLAADSGCVAMFVGMESIFEESIDETNKPFNRVEQYERQIKCFHDHGIMLNPGVIFGFDHDDDTVFEKTVDFLIQNNMELAYFNILTPLPGTPLFDRMKAEGRILHNEWEKYDGKHVVFKPKRMSMETLQEGFYWANHRFYSHDSIMRRLFYTNQRLLARWMMNMAFRSIIKRTSPKGSISPLSQVIQNLQTKLPSVETENLIPNALNSLREKVQEVSGQVSGQIDRFLQIRAQKTETLRELRVNLEGTLDRLNAKELKKRILQATEQAKVDIVLNFEHLQHATPAAFSTLADPQFLKKIADAANVKFMNLKKSFQQAVDPALLALDMEM